ncbi:MAG: hypothetical protein ABIH69_05260, partial [bacterium]
MSNIIERAGVFASPLTRNLKRSIKPLGKYSFDQKNGPAKGMVCILPPPVDFRLIQSLAGLFRTGAISGFTPVKEREPTIVFVEGSKLANELNSPGVLLGFASEVWQAGQEGEGFRLVGFK